MRRAVPPNGLDTEEPLERRQQLRVPSDPNQQPKGQQAEADEAPSNQNLRSAGKERGGDPAPTLYSLLVQLNLVELHALGLGSQSVSQDVQVHALAAVACPSRPDLQYEQKACPQRVHRCAGVRPRKAVRLKRQKERAVSASTLVAFARSAIAELHERRPGPPSSHSRR